VYSDGAPCHAQPLTARLAKLKQLWESRFVGKPMPHVRYPSYTPDGGTRWVKTYDELIACLEYSIEHETEVLCGHSVATLRLRCVRRH
jgi:hypothetical protein